MKRTEELLLARAKIAKKKLNENPLVNIPIIKYSMMVNFMKSDKIEKKNNSFILFFCASDKNR